MRLLPSLNHIALSSRSEIVSVRAVRLADTSSCFSGPRKLRRKLHHQRGQQFRLRNRPLSWISKELIAVDSAPLSVDGRLVIARGMDARSIFGGRPNRDDASDEVGSWALIPNAPQTTSHPCLHPRLFPHLPLIRSCLVPGGLVRVMARIPRCP